MNIDYQILPLSGFELSVEKLFTVGNTYSFRFDYNSVGDFITCAISDQNGNLLLTTKIVYGRPLIDAVVDELALSNLIIPLNPQQFSQLTPMQGQIVNQTTIGDTVFLFIGKAT